MKSFNNYGPAIRDLQRECAFKLRHVRVAYAYNGTPAQRYLKDGRVRYRPWKGYIGGEWPKKTITAILTPRVGEGFSAGERQ